MLDCSNSCETLSHSEKDLPSAIGSIPFLLGDINKMPANRSSWHGLYTGKEGIAAASFFGRENMLVGKQFERKQFIGKLPPFTGQVGVVCLGAF